MRGSPVVRRPVRKMRPLAHRHHPESACHPTAPLGRLRLNGLADVPGGGVRREGSKNRWPRGEAINLAIRQVGAGLGHALPRGRWPAAEERSQSALQRWGALGLKGASKAFTPRVFTFRLWTRSPHVAWIVSNRGPPKQRFAILPLGGRNDPVHAAGLVAELDAHARGDIEPAVAVDPHAVRAGVVGRVGRVQVVVALLVGERTVGLDLIAVDPVAAAFGDIQERLVGRCRHAVGELQPGVDDAFLAFWADVPDLARLGRDFCSRSSSGLAEPASANDGGYSGTEPMSNRESWIGNLARSNGDHSFDSVNAFSVSRMILTSW